MIYDFCTISFTSKVVTNSYRFKLTIDEKGQGAQPNLH